MQLSIEMSNVDSVFETVDYSNFMGQAPLKLISNFFRMCPPPLLQSPPVFGTKIYSYVNQVKYFKLILYFLCIVLHR